MNLGYDQLYLLNSVFSFVPVASQKHQLSSHGYFLKHSHNSDCENDSMFELFFNLVLTSTSKQLS